MAYSTEVVQRARERLATAKADRDSLIQQRLAEAYRKVPRLRQIDCLLRQTMAATVQAAFAKGEDVRTLLNQVKQENQSLQAERQALVDAHFPQGWLDDSPICNHCSGTGYIGSTMCSCLAELCRQEQKKELTLLAGSDASFDQFRLDYYPDVKDPKLDVNIRSVMARTYDVCRQYAQNFSEKSGNLLFSGDTGLGKTFLSACIAKAVTERGFSVAYESAGHMFAHMERAKFEGDEDAREKVKKYAACDLLIVDDLGTEMTGQFNTASLYTLINDRILSGKATIISTNLTTDDIVRRYNPQIASRLRGSFQRLAFLGEDIRLKKGLGML